jgi:hypothetical protein
VEHGVNGDLLQFCQVPVIKLCAVLDKSAETIAEATLNRYVQLPEMLPQCFDQLCEIK